MLKKFCQCIGLASIILIINYGAMLGNGYDVRMHVPFDLRGIVAAQLTDILVLGLALFLVLAPLMQSRLASWVRLGLCIVVPPYLIARIQAVLPFPLSDGLLAAGAVLWAGVVIFLPMRFRRGYVLLLRAGEFAGVFFAVFFMLSVAGLLYILRWQPGPHEHSVTWARSPQPPRQHPLMVWVVFDELSYDQVFEHRAQGLALPSFDALRDESTVFTDAQPIGDKTVRVLPSLLTGRVIDAYDFTFKNRFKIHYAGIRGFQPLDPSQAIFADAQREGWRTAVVGWYNPYCVIYADTIDDCYWMNFDQLDGPMAQRDSFWSNTWTPLRQTAQQIVSPAEARRSLCDFDVQHRYDTYVDLEQHVTKLLQTDQADLMFLHLPIPHSPNIWNRADGGFTKKCGGSYLDSLAFTDRELGRIVSKLESSPRWKDTTLIVQGDHSWRNYLWKSQPAWTQEDRDASRSGFDPRPAVMIHKAGQTQPEIVAVPWSLLKIHGVVEQVLKGQPISY